jgi:hypothetical protein
MPCISGPGLRRPTARRKVASNKWRCYSGGLIGPAIRIMMSQGCRNHSIVNPTYFALPCVLSIAINLLLDLPSCQALCSTSTFKAPIALSNPSPKAAKFSAIGRAPPPNRFICCVCTAQAPTAWLAEPDALGGASANGASYSGSKYGGGCGV